MTFFILLLSSVAGAGMENGEPFDPGSDKDCADCGSVARQQQLPPGADDAYVAAELTRLVEEALERETHKNRSGNEEEMDVADAYRKPVLFPSDKDLEIILQGRIKKEEIARHNKEITTPLKNQAPAGSDPLKPNVNIGGTSVGFDGGVKICRAGTCCTGKIRGGKILTVSCTAQ